MGQYFYKNSKLKLFLALLVLLVFLVLLVYLANNRRDSESQERPSGGPESGETSIEEPRDYDIITEPLKDSRQRVTKKPFGLYVDPQNSPVSSERFYGYHSGVDFEILESEANSRVPVFAICKGSVVYSDMVTGYGGVIIQRCNLDDRAVTVLYGHLDLNDEATVKINTVAEKGENIGALGMVGEFTDGERRHLHLGIHKGESIDFRGYVEERSELNQWLDARDFLK